METWDCLWAVGIFWVREMRNKTLPTSSSFRVNTYRQRQEQMKSRIGNSEITKSEETEVKTLMANQAD